MTTDLVPDLNLFDHLYLFAVFVLFPIAATRSYRSWLRAVEAGEAPHRLKAYAQTMAVQWSALAVLVLLWFWQARPWSDLGFVAVGGWGFWLGLSAIVVMLVVSLLSWRSLRDADEEQRRSQREALGTLVHFLPHDRRELRGFFAVSCTAGTVEEVIYRGFAFWYLAAWLPLWAVVIVTALGFALAHLYQGVGNATRVFGIGLVFGVLYPLTGSIWLPIFAHALFDILQGLMIYEILRQRDEEPGAAAPA